MSLKQVSENSEVDERLAALINNAGAVRAISTAVEGTIGPKGLDTMLVDKYGNVVITNAGVTILDLMEVSHPAAKMLINVAKAQHQEIGDGTTTATLMAGALITQGVEQVMKGVPVARIIEGMRIAAQEVLQVFHHQSKNITDVHDPVLKQVALVAGREHEDIAQLVVQAAVLIGKEKLLEPGFKLADTICSTLGAENQVFSGVILNKERMNRQMITRLDQVGILIIDDALEPEELEDEALSTEAGFNRYLTLRQEFEDHVRKIGALGVNLVLTDRGINDLAEEIFLDLGIMAVERVSHKELRRVAEHTGARMIKRSGLKKESSELKNYLGWAGQVQEDEKLGQIFIKNGRGKSMATIQVGASTEEVVGERERIAKDAAAAVQVAVQGGVLPGGGAIELAALREVEGKRSQVRGMAAYGMDCVAEALKKPFSQIVANAGFNPLEKLGDVVAAQTEGNTSSLAINCDTGGVEDMFALGVIDPALVKIHAFQAAREVAEAILRIDTIIKMKTEENIEI
ncbi:TCP-1/cpn60 chaperonin family protein [Dehalobacterium formicoaceticum]|uniref:TCP-1/cpn60 chaperonin family protein n=1 Tax=Dehalobacterium formicoaceticum TaxID=51515 RepID=A0ABT1Y483_9FIRM|nr:TCP-1/cpn60 chaperonin family protein [Dehalobacterium formicoaceticum]MCR6544945.1 TCP-1/cpn60 chaperonin family protein [Dehalobacterium formicoaceticum]